MNGRALRNRGEAVTLDAAISAVYTGPLDGFTARRDALVKALRAAKRREDATAVKALRKPSRKAWALGAAAREQPRAIEDLATAADTAVARASSGDVRAALAGLRAAVQDFAGAAARVATDAGTPVDAADLVNAVMAVLGSSDAFALLRAGRLVDIPEAGGLDLLTAMQTGLAAAAPNDIEAPTEAAPDATASLEALREAAETLEQARERSASAERAVIDAETTADEADRRLRLAQKEVTDRHAERDRARAVAREATAQLRAAEDSFVRAKAARAAEVEPENG